MNCPKCSSSQLAAGTKGFGLGKAVVGGLLLGAPGLLGGVIGSKKLRLTCVDCGHTWIHKPKRESWTEKLNKFAEEEKKKYDNKS
jgi:hypothetical protein